MSAIGVKTPGERKDFSINWATDLGTDTISTSTWSIAPNGPVVFLSSNTTQSATAWISGGLEGRFYDVSNTITTVGGRTLTQTFKIEITAENNI